MRIFPVSLLALLILPGMVLADSIYLRDGSVIKGTFIGFADGEFMVETSIGKRQSYPAGYVLRVEMDRSDPDARPGVDRFPGKRPPGPGTSPPYQKYRLQKIIEVPARDAWTDTGIDLESGMKVEITAEGEIRIGERSSGPDGIRSSRDNRSRYPVPDQGLGAVIGKIRYGNGRESPAFLVGSRWQADIDSNRTGRLYLGINDDVLGDNSGSYSIDVIADRISYRRPKYDKTVEIAARDAWTDTGIDLDPAAWIEISAEGKIRIGERSAGPDGIRSSKDNTSRYPMPGEGLGAVIAKIRYSNGRESKVFLIGSKRQLNIETNRTGRLYLGINDDYVRDNSGTYRVTIRWE